MIGLTGLLTVCLFFAALAQSASAEPLAQGPTPQPYYYHKYVGRSNAEVTGNSNAFWVFAEGPRVAIPQTDGSSTLVGVYAHAETTSGGNGYRTLSINRDGPGVYGYNGSDERVISSLRYADNGARDYGLSVFSLTGVVDQGTWPGSYHEYWVYVGSRSNGYTTTGYVDVWAIYYGIPPDLTATTAAQTQIAGQTLTAIAAAQTQNALQTQLAPYTQTPGACSQATTLYPNGPGNTTGSPGPSSGAFDFQVAYDELRPLPGLQTASWGMTVAVPAGQTLHADLETYDANGTRIGTSPGTLTQNMDASQLLSFSYDGSQAKRMVAHFYGTCEGCMVQKVVLNLDRTAACLTPTPPGPSQGHWIKDGDMEQLPVSSYWMDLYSGFDPSFGNEDGQGGKEWMSGRLSTRNIFDWLSNGGAACDNGFHAVGVVKGFLSGNNPASPIEQGFEWDGGMLYWKVMMRGTYGGLLPVDAGDQSSARVYLLDSDGTNIPLIDDRQLTASWETISGHLDLAAGHYTLRLARGLFGKGYSYDSVYYDNVVISNGPIPEGCNTPYEIPGTKTPTLNPTAGDGGITNTPGPSPTPIPHLVNLTNCGFWGEAGWQHNAQSYLGTAGGPVAAQFAIARGAAPSWWQNFSTSAGGMTQLKAFVRGEVNIQMTNLGNGNKYPVLSGTYASWTQATGQAYLPAGSYRIELNTTNATTEGDYDGVVISQNGFPENHVCLMTPTPGPTSFVTLTPTPTGAWQTATRTPTMTGTPQIYPTATYYYGPTQPLNPETATAISSTLESIHSTQTVMATQGTPWAGTPIPGGTGTPGTPAPGGTYVPGPVPDQPGPGEGAACIRPSSPLDLAHWIDYEVCAVLTWASWGPSQSATLQAIPAQFQAREPFGTINELEEVSTTIKGYVNTLDTYTSRYDNPFIDAGEPAINPFLPGTGSPWNGGKITLQGSASGYLTSCTLSLTQFTGTSMAPSLCFIFDILRKLALLPWLQSFINVSALLGLAYYIKRSWIDKGMQG